MKKRILSILITICLATNAYTQEQLDINTNKSELKWSCDYSFYNGGHYGLVEFKEGYFIKTNGKITGGTFIIDLNTLRSTDIESDEGNKDLTAHLKNEDFFEVQSYPTAKLVINKTEYHDDSHLKIWAYLTIKDITLPIDFQSEIDYEKQSMTTKFKIDRTLWHINYKSKSRMVNLKESAISDVIGFEVKLYL